MTNSFLHKISETLKNEDISINGLYYKFSDIFPESFYEIAISYIKQAFSKFTNAPKVTDFFIGFDKKRNAYLEFIGKIIVEDPSHNIKREKETRVIILEDNLKYDCAFPASLIKKEMKFLEEVKELDNIKTRQIINNLPKEFVKRFIKESKMEDLLENIATEIIEYIKYLDFESKKVYELLKQEIKESKEIEQIYFLESDASTNSTRTTTHMPTIHAERKNPEISFEKRKEILDNYSAEETFEARSKNSDSVYYVKVFKVKEKCKLIMEPIEGNKYTKVVYINQEKLNTCDIRKIVINFLELSRKETTDTKEITRHSHTTLEEYKKLLEYLITEQNKGLNGSTKTKIDEANNLKR